MIEVNHLTSLLLLFLIHYCYPTLTHSKKITALMRFHQRFLRGPYVLSGNPCKSMGGKHRHPTNSDDG
jgi:hypothetical protein